MALSGSVLRSERFVVAVEVGGCRWNVLQVQFSSSDGSILVNFPYFRHTTGIVSLVTVAGGTATPTLELEIGGHVSSHLVKYSHHPDGRAHFSQTGRVYTRIRKHAVPLGDADGHLFTVHAQGLREFGAPRSRDTRDQQPNVKRTVLSFRFEDQNVDAVKVVGHLHSAQSLGQRTGTGVIHPKMQTLAPDGTISSAFVCSAPPGSAGQHRCLLLSCVSTPRLDQGREASLLFLGGFDSPRVANDISVGTTVLAFSYPVVNADELRRRIGSIDLAAERA